MKTLFTLLSFTLLSITIYGQCTANAGNDNQICGLATNMNAIESPTDVQTHWLAQSGITFGSSDNPNSTVTANSPGTYYLIWQITNNAALTCTDTVKIVFIETPQSNAGGIYWPGLFGNNSYIKTDTVCGLNYQMNAIPTIGYGNWFCSDPTNVHFGNISGPQQTSVQNDSLYLSCINCYSVFNLTGPKYREFIWEEDNQGCIDSDTLRIYFAPHPTGTFTTSMPACRHDSSLIIANTWPLPNSLDYNVNNFQWYYPLGQLSSVILNPEASDSIYVRWPYGEQHNVMLITRNTWGCSSGMVSNSVTEPSNFNPSYTLTQAHCGDCSGEILLSTANGSMVNYYTFFWKDSIFMNPTALIQTGLCPFTSYNIIVNGPSFSPDAYPGTICHDEISIFVGDTGFVTARFDTLCFQQNQTVPYSVQFINNSIGGQNYSWRIYDESGSLIYTSTLESPNYTFVDEGCFQIVLIAQSKWGCKDTMTYNSLCVPVIEQTFNETFTVFPNPVINSNFVINYKSIIFGNTQIKIITAQGKEVYNCNISKTSESIDIPMNTRNMTNGYYIIELISGNNVMRKSILIQ